MEGDGVRVFTNEELEGIVLRYKDMVYRVAFTHTRGPTEADDVFQEVFLRLVRREEPFASEEHLKAWLLRLTIHCACDLHRTAWARRVTSYDEALDKGDGGISEPSAWMGVDGPEDELREAVFSLAHELRSAGIRTEANYQGRSLKSQFKQADKLGAALMVVVGGDELAQGAVRVRDMATHEETLVPRDALVDEVRSRLGLVGR